MVGENLPLAGINGLVMRQPEQAKSLLEGLNKLGGNSFLVPLLAFKKRTLKKTEEETLHQLKNFHWFVFTSKNGVDFFMEILQDYGLKFPKKRKIAAVGTKTEQAIKRYGLHVDFYPDQFTGEELGREMAKFVQPDENVLIIKGNLARDLAGQALTKSTINVKEVTVYETNLPESSKKELVDCLKNNPIDLLIFTSPSTVENFFTILKEYSCLDLAEDKVIACIGPVTKEALKKIGLEADIVPKTYTAEETIHAIANYFTRMNTSR